MISLCLLSRVGVLWCHLGSAFAPVGAGAGLCREGTLASPASCSPERIAHPTRATQASPLTREGILSYRHGSDFVPVGAGVADVVGGDLYGRPRPVPVCAFPSPCPSHHGRRKRPHPSSQPPPPLRDESASLLVSKNLPVKAPLLPHRYAIPPFNNLPM
jgi:hypothetical protein